MDNIVYFIYVLYVPPYMSYMSDLTRVIDPCKDDYDLL